jgi:hypothetical protein
LKFVVTANDLLTFGGAALAVAALGLIHWALVPAALGAALAGVGLWRNHGEPAGRGPRPG